MSHYDVVVVGAGLAGMAAAVRVAESGARVLVLCRGVGATHLSPVTIDVLGYALPGLSERVERPVEALRRLHETRPDHPYAVAGADAVGPAVEWFRALVAAGSLPGYAYVGGVDENMLVPTAVGVPRPSAVVPETMAGGDLRDRAPVRVVGFRGLKDFHPALLADNLARGGWDARAILLDLAPERRADVSALGFARALDTPRFRAAVVARLDDRLRAGERVAFPAVLGISDPHAAWSELERRLGRTVFEVPTLPPSVPGMRVFAILREALRRAGGHFVHNVVVTGAERTGTRVTALRSRVGLRAGRHGADWVVLATGGFASGGLALDSRWEAREPALGLPVTGVPSADRFRPEYFGEHPIGRAGVAVDHELRPLAAGGERAYDNVLVAGATLAGAEPWREKSGDGISLVTGHRAAELVLAASGAGAAAMAAGG